METSTFDKWFATYFNQEQAQVTELLSNSTATRFLIAWSLLETSRFNGFARLKMIEDFAFNEPGIFQIVNDELDNHVRFFYDRYQDSETYKNLMHEQKSQRMNELVGKNFQEFSPHEKIFFVMIVIYRYRNNIFHGNKGVASWLKYEECIIRCTEIMQLLIPMPEKNIA